MRSRSEFIREVSNHSRERLQSYRLEKLCEDHGYSNEWVSGRKPRLTARGEDNKKQNGQLRSFSVVPRLSISSGSNSSTTSTLQVLSSTNPAQERSDGPASGNWYGSPSETKNKNKKRDGNRDSDNRLRDLLAWLEEFTDNLKDTELHAPASHFSGLRFGPSYDVQRKWYQNQRCKVFSTHFPKDPKLRSLLANQNDEGSLQKDTLAKQCLEQKSFGDLMTADHKVLNEEGESRNNHQYAVVVQDPATQWIQSYPCKTETSQETEESSRKFLEPSHKPQGTYTDNSLEFGKSGEDLSWNYSTSPPHRFETEWHR